MASTNQFDRRVHKMLCKGVWTGPVDLIPDGYYPRLLNVRVRQPGLVASRLGLLEFYTNTIEDPPGTALTVHSLRRLSDDPTPPSGNITIAGVAPSAFFPPPLGQLWTSTKVAGGESATISVRNYSPVPPATIN